MRLFAVMATAALGLGGAAPAAAGHWVNAIEVPGIAALNQGAFPFAKMTSLSCSSGGDCAAGGFYSNRTGHDQAFVASQRNDRWSTAIEVPGTASLNKQNAAVASVSCGSAGNCAAGGTFEGSHFGTHAFVVTQRDGKWGKAVVVPGIGIESLSCPAPGNCVASGSISTQPQQSQALLVTERNGRWGQAFAVPSIARLDTGDDADATAVSCWSAGNCVAGGTYTNQVSSQAFVVTDRNGRWGTAFEVPGTGHLNSGRNATITVLSCTAGGECGAGGDYSVQAGSGQNGEVFVATRT